MRQGTLDLSPGRRGPKPVAHPTPREIEVLQLVYQGMDNKEIGRTLFISPLTVKRHLFLLSQIWCINSRTRLVTFALEQGWLQLPAKEAVSPSTKKE